ncbi:MAG: cation:proton antiporter [Pseudomonadales bacterium]|jgi:Kef-type K+ transport system membrane component KefB|nr:cation:proton antiporter [Pseudomonadales bacterium]
MTDHDVFLYVSCLCLILCVAASARYLAKFTGIPLVLIELLGGIALGPTWLGLFSAPSPLVLPEAAAQAFDGMVQVGGILLLFIVGMEINLRQIIIQRRTVISVSLLGFAVPFLLGVAAVKWFPSLWPGAAAVGEFKQAMLIGAILSITALPVIARLLADLRLLQSHLGAVIIGAAVIDDLLGWTLFTAISSSHAASMSSPLRIAASVAVMVACCVALGPRLMAWVGPRLESQHEADNSLLGLMLACAFLFAALLAYMGFHAGFGAFLAGLLLSTLKVEAKAAINATVSAFFSPIYFIAVGLQLNFARFFDWKLVLLLTLIAIVGKMGGAFIGARFCGLTPRKSIFIGFGMNVRGAVGIIMATAAFQAALVDETTYVALISMAILTTLVGGVGLKALRNA